MNTRRLGCRSLVRQLGSWNSQSRRPLYVDLADALRVLILDGRLRLGMRLPGEREVAEALSISRTTVSAAYGTLRDEGYLVSRRGSGHSTSLPAVRGAPVSALLPDNREQGVVDLGAAALPASERVHAAYSTALAALPSYLPDHGYEPVGISALRSTIAERYTRRGLPTGPDEVLVTNGAQNGLFLLLRTFARPSDNVLIDHPTYPHAIDALLHALCTPVPIPLPEDGWDLDAFAASLKQACPRMAYLITDFHNPTGRCMNSNARARVAETMRKSDVMLIVDETMTDLWMEGPPPPPIGAFGSVPRFVCIGSVGKSFWGGLRIGWIRASADIISALARARPAVDLGTPILEQLAATYLLSRDEPELLESRRAGLRQGHAVLLDIVGRSLPGWITVPAAGGVSVWTQMPAPVAGSLVREAQEAGVRIVAGSRFGLGGAFERYIRLPFTLPSDELIEGVARLATAFERLGSRQRRRPSPLEDRLAVV